MITNAREAALFSSSRVMVRSPETFEGTLDQLVENFVLPNLPSAEVVASFHGLLLDYCRNQDPLFLIRHMRDTERGQVYSTAGGNHFKATDNAPAWWVHFALFHQIALSVTTFPEIVATMPTHFFEVSSQIPKNISSAGWHVAHIADVKDRNVDFASWTRDDLTARFLRSIHPCNNFPIPKRDWQKWGADKRIVGFFGSLYAERYRDVWTEFREVARVRVAYSPALGTVNYSYSVVRGGKSTRVSSGAKPRRVNKSTIGTHREGNVEIVTYSASRLLFRADVIDDLRERDRFRIVTPGALYEMSKADFMRAFPRVSQTKSYRKSRIYHYRTTPAAAEEFRVTADEPAKSNDT